MHSIPWTARVLGLVSIRVSPMHLGQTTGEGSQRDPVCSSRILSGIEVLDIGSLLDFFEQVGIGMLRDVLQVMHLRTETCVVVRTLRYVGIRLLESVRDALSYDVGLADAGIGRQLLQHRVLVGGHFYVEGMDLFTGHWFSDPFLVQG